jgi:hypothetical protein
MVILKILTVILPSSVISLFFPVPSPHWMKNKMINPPKNVHVKTFLVSEGVFRCKIRHLGASEERAKGFFASAIK